MNVLDYEMDYGLPWLQFDLFFLYHRYVIPCDVQCFIYLINGKLQIRFQFEVSVHLKCLMQGLVLIRQRHLWSIVLLICPHYSYYSVSSVFLQFFCVSLQSKSNKFYMSKSGGTSTSSLGDTVSQSRRSTPPSSGNQLLMIPNCLTLDFAYRFK